jgi:hypothetical protein
MHREITEGVRLSHVDVELRHTTQVAFHLNLAIDLFGDRSAGPKLAMNDTYR